MESKGKKVDSDILFAEPGSGPLRNFPVVEGTWLSGPGGRSPVQIVLNRAALQSIGTAAQAESRLHVQQATGSWPVDVVGVVDDGSVKPAIYGNIAD
jgi:hypothetical protein